MLKTVTTAFIVAHVTFTSGIQLTKRGEPTNPVNKHIENVKKLEIDRNKDLEIARSSLSAHQIEKAGRMRYVPRKIEMLVETKPDFIKLELKQVCKKLLTEPVTPMVVLKRERDEEAALAAKRDFVDDVLSRMQKVSSPSISMLSRSASSPASSVSTLSNLTDGESVRYNSSDEEPFNSVNSSPGESTILPRRLETTTRTTSQNDTKPLVKISSTHGQSPRSFPPQMRTAGHNILAIAGGVKQFRNRDNSSTPVSDNSTSALSKSTPADSVATLTNLAMHKYPLCRKWQELEQERDRKYLKAAVENTKRGEKMHLKNRLITVPVASTDDTEKIPHAGKQCVLEQYWQGMEKLNVFEPTSYDSSDDSGHESLLSSDDDGFAADEDVASTTRKPTGQTPSLRSLTDKSTRRLTDMWTEEQLRPGLVRSLADELWFKRCSPRSLVRSLADGPNCTMADGPPSEHSPTPVPRAQTPRQGSRGLGVSSAAMQGLTDVATRVNGGSMVSAILSSPESASAKGAGKM